MRPAGKSMRFTTCWPYSASASSSLPWKSNGRPDHIEFRPAIQTRGKPDNERVHGRCCVGPANPENGRKSVSRIVTQEQASRYRKKGIANLIGIAHESRESAVLREINFPSAP